MNSVKYAIQAHGLSKIYKIYKIYPRILDMLRESITRRSCHTKRIVLDDINLDLKRGEIVGILGRNGAGKSTLLKILAGTISRTTGELTVTGRITAILELGTGFHPEYTGRENIYMGGLCLGMTRQEIDTKLQSIIEFSELQDYIDQPFKTYSTGMQARLTFSTAISVEPDILIVDEALSVGDARFQMKCFGRIQQLRERNTTILLVSHDINTITQICDRAIILEHGRIYAEGHTKTVTSIYHKLLFGNSNLAVESKSSVTTTECLQPIPSASKTLRYGSGEGKLLDWGILDTDHNHCKVIASGTFFRLYMLLEFMQDIDNLSFGFAIKDQRGTVLWGVTNISQDLPAYQGRVGEKLSITADGYMWLAAGNYFANLGVGHLADGEKIDFVENAIEFKVVGPAGIFTTSTVNLQTQFQISSNISEKKEIQGCLQIL